MKILVANYKLSTISGTETFTYTLVEELVRRGFEVEYFTFHRGFTSQKIEENLGVKFMSKNHYDLILASHNTCVKELFSYGYIIQTVHGIYPELEQPSPYADFYVSISNEIQNYLSILGFPSVLIKNGINLERFYAQKKLNKEVKKILSLCHSDEANDFIRSTIERENIELIQFDKYKNPIWNIEDYINEVDLVIGLGRSLYDAMACGRSVICFDNRHQYMDSFGDGHLREIIYGSIDYNCSGRFLKKQFIQEELLIEIKKYSADDGDFFRKFAEKELCIRKNVDMYLDVFEKRLNFKNTILTKYGIYILGKNIYNGYLEAKDYCIERNKKLRKILWKIFKI